MQPTQLPNTIVTDRASKRKDSCLERVFQFGTAGAAFGAFACSGLGLARRCLSRRFLDDFDFVPIGADHHGNAIKLSAVACAARGCRCNWPPHHSPGSSVLSFITACSSMARFCCPRSIVAPIIASFWAAALD